MPDLLVRDVPQGTVEALKRRAARHRRSLQQELLGILETSAEEPQVKSPAQVAATIRARLAKTGRTFTDSAPSIREDRER